MTASVFSSDRAGQGLQAEINITPLVDVMLVLLVIFMVTAPALAMRAEVGLPQSGPAPLERPSTLVLEVGSSGQWWLDGVAASRAEVRTRLTAVATQSPRTILKVQAEDDADYQGFVSALAAADQSGMRNVVTEPS